MIHFITFLALVVSGVQPAAFQRRQYGSIQVPAECTSTCNPVNTIIGSENCTPSQCCLASFETSYFNCFVCVATTINLTDYSVPQSIIDSLYDQCASLGLQLPVLTFPGQNTTRALSSVVQLPSSQTVTVSSLTVPTPSIVQTTISTLTSATSPQATSTPTSTSTPSFGIRSVQTNYFHLIASAMMLGTWFYFAV